MGLERFLAWIMKYNDIHDIAIILYEGLEIRSLESIKRPHGYASCGTCLSSSLIYRLSTPSPIPHSTSEPLTLQCPDPDHVISIKNLL